MRTALLLVLLASLSLARPQSAPEPAQLDPLAPLQALVGGPWVTTFPGGEVTDTQHFERMVGGKFLRNVHHVRDRDGRVLYEGETVYGWDAGEGRLRWWYFNSTGGWIDGTVEVESDGTLVFEGENHAPAAQTARVRSTSRVDGDHLHVTTWFWREDAWAVERELAYERE